MKTRQREFHEQRCHQKYLYTALWAVHVGKNIIAVSRQLMVSAVSINSIWRSLGSVCVRK